MPSGRLATIGQDLTDLDAAGLIAVAEEGVLRRRAAEVADLRVVAARLGGEGTPGVQEFCVGELAMARKVHPAACEIALADTLDLRHRLPRVQAVVEELGCEVWLARRVARLSRHLPVECVQVVDVAVAAAISGQSPGRVIRICEAKVIEADPATHAAKVEAERHRRYVALSRADATGLRHIVARVNAGDAVWLDVMVDRVADFIADRHPAGTTGDELRSIALGWLARPAEVLQLLLPGDGEQFESGGAEGIGSLLVEHHLFTGCTVNVKPVIDLNDRVDVNCYEHPTTIRESRLLATPGDTFPYATAVPGQAAPVDLDHPRPYDPDGPPGQTGLHNCGPLGRRHHRWKTHAGHTSRQCGTTRWAWRTPTAGTTSSTTPAPTHSILSTDR